MKDNHEMARNSGPVLSGPELTIWLTERIAEHVRIPADDIGVEVPLAMYSFDSVQAFSVIAEIEDRLGLTLDYTVMWQTPTVAGLVEAIQKEMQTGS